MKKLFLKVLLLGLFISPAAAQSSLHFDATDGKTHKLILQLNASQSGMSADGINVQQSYSPAKENQPESWKITIKNHSSDERWLYLNWKVTWSSSMNLSSLCYWNGKGAPITGDELLKNPSVDASMNTTMLQAIYDDNNGLALALPPDQIVSQFHQLLEHTAAGLQLHLRIPLVLDAGQSDMFPIEIYHFAPRYGFLDALQKYFLAHPNSFNARADIDPRAAGVGSGSRSWDFEEQRRLHGDWNWFYAPFRRTGDIYGREKFWDYTPARPFGMRTRDISAQKYRAIRHKQLEQIDAMNMATAFYTPSFLYSEIQLAKEQYPGAIIYNPDGSYAKYYDMPWVTSADNQVEMYPWGNKFAEQSMKDSKDLVEENDIPAFGYDIMAGGYRFRGKGMKASPRRAFDENGEYVDSSVGIAKIADFTRNLTKDNRKIGLVGNITEDSRPFLVARADSVMFERPPYYYEGQLKSLRYAAGHKAMTFWIAWRIETKDKTPAELRHSYQEAADYIRLASYRYGAFPSGRWSTGAPKIRKMLPLLKEVISKGWQPVPAVQSKNGLLPSTLWPARYGKGVGSFITIGNDGDSAWDGEIVIDNDYLGALNYLFVDVQGEVQKQSMKGRTTILQVEIPARQTLVLRAVAEIPVKAGNATAGWSNDGAKGVLSIQSTLTPLKVLSPRDGWREISQKHQNWYFRSQYFDSPIQEIWNFPFFNDASTAQIVLADNPSTDGQWAAQHVQEYFRFWGKNGITPAEEINLPIIQKGQAYNKMNPTIIIGGSAEGVQCKGNTLIIGEANLRETILHLLTALDDKYFYVGTLPTTGSYVEALKKAGLAGKTLTSVGN